MKKKKKKSNNKCKTFIEACGGRKHYTKCCGHFDMLKAHEQFSITEKARREWFWLHGRSFKKTDISDEAKQSFGFSEKHFQKHTVNVDERQELEDLVAKKDKWKLLPLQ